jgi:hypothetical protein
VIEATWLGEKVDRNHDSTLKDQNVSAKNLPPSAREPKNLLLINGKPEQAMAAPAEPVWPLFQAARASTKCSASRVSSS